MFYVLCSLVPVGVKHIQTYSHLTPTSHCPSWRRWRAPPLAWSRWWSGPARGCSGRGECGSRTVPGTRKHSIQIIFSELKSLKYLRSHSYFLRWFWRNFTWDFGFLLIIWQAFSLVRLVSWPEINGWVECVYFVQLSSNKLQVGLQNIA